MSESSTIVVQKVAMEEGMPDPGEIGVVKADAGNKKAARSVTSDELGVTKSEVRNKEAEGSFFTDDLFAVIEAEPGNKAAGDIGFIEPEVWKKEPAAGRGVVTETDWIEFVFPKPPLELQSKAEPTGATRDKVPKVIIDRLKEKRPVRKLPPITYSSDLHIVFPELREGYLSTMAHWNYLVDMHVDVVEQVAKKGFAEFGVDFSAGVKKIFILP